MIVKLLKEHHLEFLSLEGSCTGLSEYTCQTATLVKISCRGSFYKDSNTMTIRDSSKSFTWSELILQHSYVNCAFKLTKISIAIRPTKRITNWNTSVHITLLMPPCNIGRLKLSSASVEIINVRYFYNYN